MKMLVGIIAIFGIIIFVLSSQIAADDIRDIRPPVDYPLQHDIFYWVLVVLVLVLLGIMAWCWLKRRRKRRPALVIKRLPWVIALERLDEIKSREYSGEQGIREYYTALSDVIRKYIEARFQVNAPDMTTQEFLMHINGTRVLDLSQRECLEDFLTCCDMVKFARYCSSEPEMEASYAAARKLVEETKPAERL